MLARTINKPKSEQTMKRPLLNILTVLIISLSGVAQATLVDRGNGMIYDDVLDVTWLQDANYAKTSGYDADGQMNWAAANAWVEQLAYEGYNDWRLPTISPINDSSFNYVLSRVGNADIGNNISSPNSEMAYMFHENLGNLSAYDTDGTARGGNSGTDWGVINPGFFNNLENNIYWTGVESASLAWAFTTWSGYQDLSNKDNEFYAWAVRSGDVNVSAVPVPAAVWLLGSGLVGLLSLRRKR
jgi:hypothetical protein